MKDDLTNIKKLTDDDIEFLLKYNSITREQLEEEKEYRKNNLKDKLTKWESKYFIQRSDKQLKVFRTEKWVKLYNGNCELPVETIEFNYSSAHDAIGTPAYPPKTYFNIAKTWHHWYESNLNYYEYNTEEVSKTTWDKWCSRYDLFYTTMCNLKDWI
jgi:hypothetical protein